MSDIDDDDIQSSAASGQSSYLSSSSDSEDDYENDPTTVDRGHDLNGWVIAQNLVSQFGKKLILQC